MLICRVVGNLVATQKNRKLEGAKLMLVQPLDLDDKPVGATFLAIDSVSAGVGEKVLVVIEGKAAGQARGDSVAMALRARASTRSLRASPLWPRTLFQITS